jgi:hypothetical protein
MYTTSIRLRWQEVFRPPSEFFTAETRRRGAGTANKEARKLIDCPAVDFLVRILKFWAAANLLDEAARMTPWQT